MTAKKIMDVMEENAHDTDMFGTLEQNLTNEKFNVLVILEHDPDNKKLIRQYTDICEQLRAISIMRFQRVELFYQAHI